MRKILYQVRNWLRRAHSVAPVAVQVKRVPESPRWDCVAGALFAQPRPSRGKRMW